jgi:hypothetical protein
MNAQMQMIFRNENEAPNERNKDAWVTPYARGVHGWRLTAYIIDIPFDQFDKDKFILIVQEGWNGSPTSEYPTDYGRSSDFIPFYKLWGYYRSHLTEFMQKIWQEYDNSEGNANVIEIFEDILIIPALLALLALGALIGIVMAHPIITAILAILAIFGYRKVTKRRKYSRY